MNGAAAQPAPSGNRYGGYAPKLFDRAEVERRRRLRQRATRGRRLPAGAVVRPAPGRRADVRTMAVGVVVGLGVLLLVQGIGEPRSLAEQRPDPTLYRSELDLLSIDRIGTMFCGVVSQGFFLDGEVERRRDVERLVQRIRSEGYGSLYLSEASGRTVARWDGRMLEMIPDADTGS